MSKKILYATEIQQLLQSRIDAIHEIAEDKAKVIAPLPHWHEEDENGGNWDISTLRNPNGYIHQILAVIENLKREVNLK